MSVSDHSLIIYLTGEKNKNTINLVTWSDEIEQIKTISDVSNILQDKFIDNFFNCGLNSIICSEKQEDNIQKEIIEITNSEGKKLLIKTDDFDKYFGKLKEYLSEEKRIELFNKSIERTILNNDIVEFFFKPSDFKKDTKIKLYYENNLLKMVYYIPYEIVNEKKVFSPIQLENIKELLNKYFLSRNSEILSSLDIGKFRYLEKFYIHGSNDSNVILCSHDMCDQLMEYVFDVKDKIYSNYYKILEKTKKKDGRFF